MRETQLRYSRRRFVGSAVALPFALRGLAWGQARGRLGLGSYVLLGTDAGKGIYRAAWNPVMGVLGPVELAAEVVRPAFLARHPTLPVVYAVNSTSGADAAVSSFHVDAADGRTAEFDAVESRGVAG